MKELVKNVSTEELANAYCLAIANSYRLVEDAENTFPQKRFISAVSSLSKGIFEIVRAHMIAHAARFQDDSLEWNWFWKAMESQEEQLAFLEKKIHGEIFKNEAQAKKYEKIFKILKEDFVTVYFDSASSKFLPPGHQLLQTGKDRELANEIYEYALSMYRALNVHGLPNPAAQFKIFAYFKSAAALEV